MIKEILHFELKYMLKRPETYFFFILMVLLGLLGVELIFEGKLENAVKHNASIIISKTMAAMTGLSLVIVSLIMGVPVLRDYQYNIQTLVFVNPINKKDYLFGKFIASFLILLFIYGGLPLGTIIGEFMPWKNTEDLLPFQFLTHIHSFIFIVFPILLFASLVFFTIGTLTKNVLIIYTQAIIVFVSFLLTKSIDNEFAQALLDPFSLTTLTDIVRHKTVEDLNSQFVPIRGLLIYNKLFWIVIGVTIFSFGYKKFSFTLSKTKSKKNTVKQTTTLSQTKISIPKITLDFNLVTSLLQFFHLTKFNYKWIIKQIPFLAIVISEVVIIVINSINLKSKYHVSNFPLTSLVVQDLKELSLFFFFVLIIFYSGELIWRERSKRLHMITDATPISDGINLFSKLFALTWIYITILIMMIIIGIIFQVIHGYSNFQLSAYFYSFFIETLPFLILFTISSLSIQVLVNNKYLGFALSLIFVISVLLIPALGFQHDLINFGGGTLGSYSELHGFEQEIFPFVLVKTFWMSIAISILVAMASLMQRGTEANFKKRINQFSHRMENSSKHILYFVMTLSIILASFIYYNTNILNEYWPVSRKDDFGYRYETELSAYKFKPNLSIKDINLEIDFYPERKKYHSKGSYTLINKTDLRLNEIYIQENAGQQISVEKIELNKPFEKNENYQEFGFHIFKLTIPLEPNQEINLNFEQTYDVRGFKESTSTNGVFNNGFFLNENDFPTLGYSTMYELKDNRLRKEYSLPERRSYENEIQKNGLINFQATLNTPSNYKAIAPGTLVREDASELGHSFYYEVNEGMINEFSLHCGEYEIQKDIWHSIPHDVELCLYHNEKHQYNNDKIMEAMKASLNYCSHNFSPYSYKNLTIIETANFADQRKSSPSIIPISESMAFTFNIDDKVDPDMVFFMVALEISHQWWKMQVEADKIKGEKFITESIPLYAALMIMKENFPQDKVKKLIDLYKEDYLKMAKRTKKKEVALIEVTDEEYLYRDKALINFHLLDQAIGEDKINAALKEFLVNWNSNDGILKTRLESYPTAEKFIDQLYQVTPDSMNYKIDALLKEVNAIE